MTLIEGKFEFESGINAKVFTDKNGQLMVELNVPSYTAIVVPFEELADFVDALECVVDDCCEDDY